MYNPIMSTPKILESISRSLASSYRENGPQVRSNNGVIGGVDNKESDFAMKVIDIVHNVDPAILYEHILQTKDSRLTYSGAIAVRSGAKTGRSPKDKRMVYFGGERDYVWWSDESPNIKMDEPTFLKNRETAICFLNLQDRLFVVDGYAGWDPRYRIKVRVISSRPYHALFMHNMLIRPDKKDIGEPDVTIYNAGCFPCNRLNGFMSSSTSIALDMRRKEIVILGSQYAGEMKKGIFTVMHYLMPKLGVLSLHSSCNIDKKDKDNVAIFFGLSGTGKTTLSADPNRLLVGDDEHCWTDTGVFNIEGGCYAKCIHLDPKSEPDIYNAIRFGSLLENVILKEDRQPDYDDTSITQNTRCSYPIEYIENVQIPCMGGHPQNVIFLCCDAFGVLPAVSKLTPDQAQYYFMSGYTAKIPGTEMGIKEPIPTFSACFGEAFIVCHPSKYAQLLKEKLETHDAQVWLVNTGWVGGSYGTGKRCPLKYTRMIIDSIHDGSLVNAQTEKLPIFDVDFVSDLPGIPSTVLNPMKSWSDENSYMNKLNLLAVYFCKNFKKYQSPEIAEFGPAIDQEIP
jgi:phosphoenolpyruvate carboxykinase (ATP)